MTDLEIKQQLFQQTNTTFDSLALDVFRWQAEHVEVYRRYVELMRVNMDEVNTIEQIPFLPIQFFKSNQIISTASAEIQQVFESSGTTGQIVSKHHLQDIALYEASFRKAFEIFFGDVTDYCILGLLPSYLERGQSSLVYMVNDLIAKSQHGQSGFYLHNHEELFKVIEDLEAKQQQTLLFGVTYALLDFAEQYAMQLKHVQLIETGGMKGRRKEMLRNEVHEELKRRFQIETIFSEYGMTELLSQAYSKGDGIFQTPPWMRILIRDVNDPLQVNQLGRGIVNVIDLANIYSCAFIATDDLGEIYPNGQFVITGRLDQSEMRGCSLMVSEI